MKQPYLYLLLLPLFFAIQSFSSHHEPNRLYGIPVLGESDTLAQACEVSFRHPNVYKGLGLIQGPDTSKPQQYFLEFVTHKAIAYVAPWRMPMYHVYLFDAKSDIIYTIHLPFNEVELAYDKQEGSYFFYAVPIYQVPLPALRHTHHIQLLLK